MKFRLKFTLLLSFSILITFQIQTQSQTLALSDINNLIRISSLEISPDGKSAIFITTKKNMDKNNFETALTLIDIDSKTQEIIGESIEGIGSPGWTKDGRDISLITRSEGIRQVFILDSEDQSLRQITKSKTQVVRYTWNNDGSKLAYFCRDEKVKKEGKAAFNNSFEVGSNDYLLDEPPVNTSVWMVNADGTDQHKITPNGFTVATGLTTSGMSWSSDGKSLAFTGFPSAYSGDSDLGRNYVYDLESQTLEPATDNMHRESSPRFGPDNMLVYYQFPRDGFPSNRREWYQVDLQTKKSQVITQDFDHSVSDLQWLEDGTTICRGISKWGNGIFRFEKNESSHLNMGDLASISSWSVAKNGSMVLTALKKDAPVEVYYKSSLNAKPIALTDFNRFIRDRKLGKQEGIQWKSSDDLQPTGILTYPPDFDPKKKYPLVLQIHGGPSASSLLGFSPIPQVMAANGWIVFQPNYRGSTNLGNDFQAAISKDPSEGPGHDVITGVNLLKSKSYIDTTRIAVSGWSYGGWMTSWLIGRYPDVWKCAVAGAAPVDVTDMYSLNDLNRMRRHSIVESPYVGDNLTWAFENSPISNFSKIKTPTLIMSKTEDARVTITGSYKLYGALRDNGIPVQFIAYPGPGHFPRDPVRNKDVYQRWIGWLSEYLEKGRS